MNARDKIKSLPELTGICDSAKGSGARIVFTNGCFDLLHLGHIRYLEAARQLGDLLVVAVNSDSSVGRIKGPLRPINPEACRAEIVAALHCVDYVTLFDSPDPLPLIETLLPGVLVKGADWPLDKIVGADTVIRAGGVVVNVPFEQGHSTSALIRSILDRYRE
jgi:D-glycero-beta-D-manno-heptose 1-phosphate adenylyltransferase